MTNESGKKPAMHKKHVARLERELQQTRLILYTFFGILGVVAVLLIYGWLDVNYLQLNRAVATVNDNKIVLKDFEARTRLRRQQLIDNYNQYTQYQQYFGMDMSSQLNSIETQLNTPELVGTSVLDAMIDEEIIRLEAEKRGITVSEEEIDKKMEEGFNFYPNGTPTPSLTPTPADLPTDPAELLQFITATPDVTATPLFTATAEFTATVESQPTAEGDATATLAPTNTAEPTVTPTATLGPTSTPEPTATPFTREAYEVLLGKTKDNITKYGFDETYIREFFRNQILREKLLEVIAADVKPFEEQVRARHILVADEQTAKDLIARLQAGEDFADLARQYSSDSSSEQGGDLGWFGKGQMVAEFETAAFALQNPGDFTTEPVASQFGYHIIQLMAKQERPLSASEVQNAKETALQDWLTKARDTDYTVETFDFWKQRVPSTPNFITAATESAAAQKTAQAESVATLDAKNSAAATPTP
ncbi:MAG TPA: peptidylprolyl isomerase [Anaerolineales bacterium]|nr:peptidylprolyl isomerase [Anaerolineales bacterium]HND47888.1 peptidylprolyl isomerase [Anaerolineales bacterium]HNF93661.1 peptidylprolyl isomerase [Anaerolineales bacterium]HNH25705.1 peptidylprolyl isomerase [Anaerolineales bacterium]